MTARAGSGRPGQSGPAVDKAFIRRLAHAHEKAGFDAVLVDDTDESADFGADALLIGAYAGHVTERLGLLLRHVPGRVAPALAAGQLATLDQLIDGRLAVHIAAAGADQSQTAAYLEAMRLHWSGEWPTSPARQYSRLGQASPGLRLAGGRRMSIHMGGSDPAAIALAAHRADVLLLDRPILDDAAETLALAQAARCRPAGMAPLRFSIAARPIMAATDAQAQERATGIRARQGQGDAERNGVILVGTAEHVSEWLLGCYDRGITVFMLKGFDPVEDAIDYGQRLLPLVRDGVAQREERLRPRQGRRKKAG